MKRVREECVTLVRLPIIDLLTAPTEHVIFRPFATPVFGLSERRSLAPLGYKKRRSSTDVGEGYSLPQVSVAPESESVSDENPLYLALDKEGTETTRVAPRLTLYLREHQRQGLEFMFRCLRGLNEWPECRAIRAEAAQQAKGCILADDMGLGKTLQALAALWTFHQSLKDTERGRNLILCPASLVGNWAAEVKKWLGDSCTCSAVVETVKSKVQDKIKAFKYDRQCHALIISYEGFRVNLDIISSIKFSLMILDEAHRLKNQDTQLAKAVSEIACHQRILLTGTPIQNDLDEFFTLAAVANPTIFADKSVMRSEFTNPILAGTRSGASEAQQIRAQEKLDLLSSITNVFVLRRANTLLAKVLPDKVVTNVFCSLSDVQAQIYHCLVQYLQDDKEIRKCALSVVQMLLKVCAHPLLVPASNPNKTIKSLWWRAVEEAGLDEVTTEILLRPPSIMPRGVKQDVAGLLNTARSRRSFATEKLAAVEVGPDELIGLSGKTLFVFTLLNVLFKVRQDKIVIVSNYTQTLDLIENWCRNHLRFPAVRLDGQIGINKRHTLVTDFNSSDRGFIFLLSSKAGGCGINLIGANRLILMDPDWNPANDKQALARVWRDGQKKTCHIYRLFCSGTVEEKILQRQLAKESIGSMVVHAASDTNELKGVFADEILEDLFTFNVESIPACDTHDVLLCNRCTPISGCEQLPDDDFDENDLITWCHSPCLANRLLYEYDKPVMDELLKRLALSKNWTSSRPAVTFTMSCLVESDRSTEPVTETTTDARLPIDNNDTSDYCDSDLDKLEECGI